MRGFHRAALLSLCAVFLLGISGPACAEETDQPLVYRSPTADALGGMACTAYVTPSAAFEELCLPEDELLRLDGGTYRDTLSFSYRWDQEAFAAGMASGSDTFSLSGGYGPQERWSPEQLQQWENGMILTDTPAPTAEIHVLREETLPFSADIRINYYGDLGPGFSFPWVAGMEEAILAYSLDNGEWHEELWTWDDLPSGQRQNGRAEITLIAADEDYNPVITQDTSVVYIKMTVKGSPLAGTTDVYDLKRSQDGWNMTPHDDSGGDHGGGGQGQHDRPGKEEPVQPETTPVAPEPEREPPSGGSKDPEPCRPIPGLTWEATPCPSLEPVSPPTPKPGSKQDPDGVEEARPSPKPRSSGTAEAPLEKDAGADAALTQGSVKDMEAPILPDDGAPELQAEAQTAFEPEDQPGPETPPIPGYAAAAAATAALILGGGLWFRRRRKRQ